MKKDAARRMGLALLLVGLFSFFLLPEVMLSIHSLAVFICHGPGFDLPSNSLAAVECDTALLLFLGITLMFIGGPLLFLSFVIKDQIITKRSLFMTYGLTLFLAGIIAIIIAYPHYCYTIYRNCTTQGQAPPICQSQDLSCEHYTTMQILSALSIPIIITVVGLILLFIGFNTKK